MDVGFRTEWERVEKDRGRCKRDRAERRYAEREQREREMGRERERERAREHSLHDLLHVIQHVPELSTTETDCVCARERESEIEAGLDCLAHAILLWERDLDHRL